MKLIPAIDLKDGKCVRLTKGKEKSNQIFNLKPTEQAKVFEKEGCKKIHLVDLDAAFGKNKNNKSTILDIRNSVSIDIQLGGGIRTENDINFWFKKGINFLIVGSFAAVNKTEVKKIVKNYPKMIYISLDDFKNKIMIHGWVKSSNLMTEDIIDYYNKSKIRGFVFTDVSRDGTLSGVNVKKIKNILKLSNKPVIVGGGLSSERDVKNLLNINNRLLDGVIAGKSYYLGKININKINKLIKDHA